MNRPVRAWLPVLAVVAFASGCGSGLGGTGDSGFQAGDGTITVLKAADRRTPDADKISGTTLEGDEISLSAYRGKVVVINVWGSWCAPCRSEVDDLRVAANELMPKGVVFLGINTRDNSPETALAFERKHQVPYPSIYDPGGDTLLAFNGTLNPQAIPSTLVIGADGKVAGRVLGGLTSARTLIDLVDEVSK